MIKIALIAGEASGDNLGAALIEALQSQYPDLSFSFVGVAGPKMKALGCRSLFPIEEFNVMGLVDVIKHLPRLYRYKRKLVNQFIDEGIDLFIGIDYQDFNLRVARTLKLHGIKTVQYVSPKVWAWREGRVKHIKRAFDLILCLFPFEVAFYEKHAQNASYVGHPLADHFPVTIDRQAAREELHLEDKPSLALLPGSRTSEIKRHATVFIKTARQCLRVDPRFRFLVALNDEARKSLFESVLASEGETLTDLPIHYFLGQTQTVLKAADVVLIASGTATLEALFAKCPMVVAYRVDRLSYELAKRLIKIKHIALPNILAKKTLVPEFIQDRVQATVLAPALLEQLEPKKQAQLTQAFTELHQVLRCGAAARAASAVMTLLQRKT